MYTLSCKSKHPFVFLFCLYLCTQAINFNDNKDKLQTKDTYKNKHQ